MAETEFIGPGGIVRQTILNNQGQAVINPVTTQWATAGSLKPEPVVASSTSQHVAQAGAFYGPPATAYEWKVDEQAMQAVHGEALKHSNLSGGHLDPNESLRVIYLLAR